MAVQLDGLVDHVLAISLAASFATAVCRSTGKLCSSERAARHSASRAVSMRTAAISANFQYRP